MSFFTRGAPEKREFADQLVRLMSRSSDAAKLSYDKEEFALHIVSREGKTEQLKLETLFATYQSRPTNLRVEFLEDVVWSMESSGFIGPPPTTQMPKTLEEAQSYLFPRVVSKIEADWGAEQAYGPNGDDTEQGGTNQKLAGELLADHLLTAVAFNHRPSQEFVMERTLEQWGVSFQTVFEVAVANLKRRTRQPFEQTSTAVKVYRAAYNDGFDAARIFLHDRFDECRLKGDPVAFFPQRDVLVITGSEDVPGLQTAFDMTSDIPPIGLLTSPFLLFGGKWRLFKVPDVHPLAVAVAKANLADFLQIYSQQTWIIERGLKRQHLNMTPVPIATIQHEDAINPTTMAVWTQADNPLLLPHAQQIAFMRPGETAVSAVADFEQVLAQLPELLTRLDCYPERFLVRQFPTMEHFAKLEIALDCEHCAEHRKRKAKFCTICGNRLPPPPDSPWPPTRPLL